MRPIILYRDFDCGSHEIAAASKYFDLTNSRMDIRSGDLVIGRYSVLPFYREQERDIQLAGAHLINSYQQHQYVADLRQWYPDLEGLTPKTWFDSQSMMEDPYQGPYVVKGMTNSRKDLWHTHMFAPTKADAIQVAIRLQQDTLIGQQPIVFRQYLPLKEYDRSILNAPIAYEWRFFFAYQELLCGAWYWSSYINETKPVPLPCRVPGKFLEQVIERIGGKVNFVVVDVAELADGSFTVVELNDGQMSGPSENDLDILYRRLREVVQP
jgi:hypothetical protein